MSLTPIEESLILAAYFRGNHPDDRAFTANSSQILMLSLFYTGDISLNECARRFGTRHIKQLHDETGELTDESQTRYRILIQLVNKHPELIKGGGNLEAPADPLFTACRLTHAGFKRAADLINQFPLKPEFPNWPDKRTMPDDKV